MEGEENVGKGDSSRPEDLVKSLKELETQRSSEERKVQETESSREFYLALWKASPFVLIPLFTSTLIAFVTFGDMGYFFCVALASVFGVGLYGWYATKDLDGKLADARVKAEECRKALSKRYALVELEFLKFRPSTNFLYIENVSFDERMEYMNWRSVRKELNPHLLKDMIHSEDRLIEFMDALDNHGRQYIEDVKSFYQEAKSMILRIDESRNIIQKNQPKDRLPAVTRSLYYIHSGLTSTAEEASRKTREMGLSNEVAHHLRLMLGPASDDNIYHELLGDSTLRNIAESAEKNRVVALDNEKTIRIAIQVLVGESGDTTHIGVR